MNRAKKYRTWDEAFRGLAPSLRQQSVRVADYTRLLFDASCQEGCYRKEKELPPYLTEEYADVAYKCGLYHQLGKAMLPTELQLHRSDFTDQEEEDYRSYTWEGKELVARLQGAEDGEVSIPCQMIQEACEQHMERWDGSGYPVGRTGRDISLIAQFVGIAKELDRLASEICSEQPFDEALEALTAQKGVKYSPQLITVLQDSRGELKTIFQKYIQYTKALPVTVPLVDKRPERPFGLKYSPLSMSQELGDDIYEANSWYKGSAEDPEELQSLPEVEELLERTELLGDVCTYLLYEAGDALVRMGNCGFPAARILLRLPAGYYRLPGQLPVLEQFFEDQGIDRKSLIFLVPESVVRRGTLEELSRLQEYSQAGLVLALDGFDPGHVSEQALREMEFSYARAARQSGETQEILSGLGVACLNPASELLSFTEDELIRTLLMNR